MASIFPSLLPLILGSALAPVWIVLVLLTLRSRNGLLKAFAFVAGVTTVRLLQGVLFGLVLGNAKATGDNSAAPVASTLIMVMGILLLITAVKTYRHEPGLDDPPPKWMGMIDTVTPRRMFGMGLLLTLLAPKLWVFTLSAIAVIREAEFGNPNDSVTAFLIFVLGAQSLMIAAVLLYAIAPRSSARFLESATDWLERHDRQIKIVVSTIFGFYFLWNGVSGLILS